MPYSKQTWVDGSASSPVNATRLNFMESGIETAQNTAELQGSYKQVLGLVANSTAAATANTAAIQAVLDAGYIAVLPKSYVSNVDDCFYFNSTIVIPPFGGIVGAGMESTVLMQAPGSNLDAGIAASYWYNNASRTSNSGSTFYLADFRLDMNWKDWNSPYTVRNNDTVGTGHGIAGSMFRSWIRRVMVSRCKGHGIFGNSACKDGTTYAGESIQWFIDGCNIHNCGWSGIHLADTGGGSSFNDGYILDNHLWNIGTASSAQAVEIGNFLYMQNAAGTVIRGNHCYGGATQSAKGWGCKVKHGFYLLTCGGTRVEHNQVADFGYNETAAAYYGIFTRADQYRGCVIYGNTVFTDEDVNPATASGHSYTAIRAGSATNTWVGKVTITGNQIGSRSQSRQSRAPTLTAVALIANNGGTTVATVTGNVCNEVAKTFDGGTANVTCVQEGNSWNKASATPTSSNGGFWQAGTVIWHSAPTATNIGWVCTTAGTPGTWTAMNVS